MVWSGNQSCLLYVHYKIYGSRGNTESTFFSPIDFECTCLTAAPFQWGTQDPQHRDQTLYRLSCCIWCFAFSSCPLNRLVPVLPVYEARYWQNAGSIAEKSGIPGPQNPSHPQAVSPNTHKIFHITHKYLCTVVFINQNPMSKVIGTGFGVY